MTTMKPGDRAVVLPPSWIADHVVIIDSVDDDGDGDGYWAYPESSTSPRPMRMWFAHDELAPAPDLHQTNRTIRPTGRARTRNGG